MAYAGTTSISNTFTGSKIGKPTPRDVIEARESRKYEEFILDAWSTRREYLNEWHSRLRKLDAFIIGDWSVEFPDGRIIRDRPKIENRVLTKIEDTGTEAGNSLPTIRVEPINERDVTTAERRERVLQYYWQMSELRLTLPRLFMDMIGTGMCALQVWPDFHKPLEQRYPNFKRIDPRFILPPLDHVINGDIEPHDVITHRVVKTRNLARLYPEKINDLVAVASKIGASAGQNRGRKDQSVIVDTSQVIRSEYFGRDVIYRLALIENYPETAVVLENEVNVTECCPVVLGFRPTADGRVRGKVEAMLPVIAAENRLMTYVLDYMDQAVYSPLEKTSEVVNAEDFGPSAIIDLGPAAMGGKIGRVPPAQVNPEVFRIIQEVERHGRNVGTLPMSRQGSVDQSQASASFVESLNSGLITEIQTMQMVMEVMLRQANTIAQEQDKAYCDTEKMIYGLAKGGSFREKYTPSALLKDTANFVSYGAGAGLDKFNAEIRMSQRMRDGVVSKRWVRENMEGIENITQEEKRIAEEAALAAYMQGMLTQAAQTGDLSAFGAFVQAIDAAGGNMLEALLEIVKQNPGVLQAPLPPGPAPQQASALGAATALQKGALPGGPGAAVPAAPGTPGTLPPLSQLLMR